MVQIDNEPPSSSYDLSGVHSVDGWKDNLPIRIYLSQEILDSINSEIRNSDSSAVSPESIVEQIMSALHTWEDALNYERGTMFQVIGLIPDRGTELNGIYKTLDKPINALYYDFAWLNNTQKSNGVLATTAWRNYLNRPTAIERMSIRYNNQGFVFGDAVNHMSNNRKKIVDLQSLTLHEVGHAIGLSHVNENDSVMYPYMNIGPYETHRDLSENDIERIRFIYSR
jgi:hypothetical protein